MSRVFAVYSVERGSVFSHKTERASVDVLDGREFGVHDCDLFVVQVIVNAGDGGDPYLFLNGIKLDLCHGDITKMCYDHLSKNNMLLKVPVPSWMG